MTRSGHDAGGFSFARSLGACIGHIVRAVKTPVGNQPKRSVTRVEERTIQTAQGRVLLRRSITDEAYAVGVNTRATTTTTTTDPRG